MANRDQDKDQMKIPDNPFAHRMAKLLKYGTNDFDQSVGELSKKIWERFGKKVSPYTIKSWINISQSKIPQLKNLEMVALIYGYTDPFEMMAPEKGEDEITIGPDIIQAVEMAFEKLLPLLDDKYIKIDALPEEKQDVIRSILKVRAHSSLQLIKSAIRVSLDQEKESVESQQKG
jgi:hypothetical protein